MVMLHTRIWPRAKWVKWTSNVHNDRTYKEHRNLEIRKHVTTSCSGTKFFFINVELKVSTQGGETIFCAALFIWSPSRAAPIGRKFASRLRAPKVDPSRLASNYQLLTFFRFSHKPPRASSAWRHPHPVTPFRLGVLWHLSDTSIRPCAPALTPASMLHPTNPCAEPKLNSRAWTEIPRLLYNSYTYSLQVIPFF